MSVQLGAHSSAVVSGGSSVITVTSTATDGHTGVIAIFQNGVGSRTYAIGNVEGTSTWVTAAASTQSGGVTHMRQDYSTNVITNNGTVSFTVTQSGGVVIGFGATFITIASSGINLAASTFSDDITGSSNHTGSTAGLTAGNSTNVFAYLTAVANANMTSFTEPTTPGTWNSLQSDLGAATLFHASYYSGSSNLSADTVPWQSGTAQRALQVVSVFSAPAAAAVSKSRRSSMRLLGVS